MIFFVLTVLDKLPYDMDVCTYILFEVLIEVVVAVVVYVAWSMGWI